MKHLPLLIICICTAVGSYSQNFAVRTVKNNLFIPWEIIYGPDGNIWYTQKNGYICRTEPATGNTDTLYHETNNVIQSEGGMLGMALHPSFPTQPYIYAAYEYTQGGYKERIVRYTYYPVGDTLGSPMTLLEDISGNSFHNGCRLLIVNDKLFISTGDAGTTSNSQNVNSLNGKILRINLDGTIPSDNPIPGNPAWSWGDRNSQGMTYANGILYTSMHGANIEDEVNIIEAGRNYGWPIIQGYCDQPGEMTFCNDSNVVEPIYSWSPTIAPAGIEYYDHPMFPQWQNSLVMCSLKDTSLWILKLNSTHDAVVTAIRIDTLHLGRIRDICISPDGSIFLSTSNSQAGGTGAKIDRIVELYDSTYIPVKAAQMLNNDAITIYPNPTQNEVRISIGTKQLSGRAYTVINAMGQVVLEGTLADNTVSLKNLPAGLYQLKLGGAKGEVYTGKILKE